MRLLCSLSIIGKNFLAAFSVTVFMNIFSGANLTLVKMAVSHHAVFIKLGQWLGFTALKT